MTTTPTDRHAAYIFGLFAELRVMLYLLLRDYRLYGWRVRTPFGEVDILAGRPGHLVIVEVKARRRHDTALYAVTHRQQERLKRAASFLLSTRAHHTHDAIRFDCCTVSWYMRVHHHINAFD